MSEPELDDVVPVRRGWVAAVESQLTSNGNLLGDVPSKGATRHQRRLGVHLRLQGRPRRWRGERGECVMREVPGIWQPLEMHTAQARVIEAARDLRKHYSVQKSFEPPLDEQMLGAEMLDALEALDLLAQGSTNAG